MIIYNRSDSTSNWLAMTVGHLINGRAVRRQDLNLNFWEVSFKPSFQWQAEPVDHQNHSSVTSFLESDEEF